MVMKEDNIVKQKSFDFAVRIIKLYQYLSSDKKEFVLSKQILRSGTSVGAMIRESEHAQKEINEIIYWLELFQTTDYLSVQEFESMNENAVEIIKLITSIIKTTKNNINN